MDDELLQILGALSQQSIDKDRLNRSSAQHANALDASRQSQERTIDQDNVRLLADSLNRVNQNIFTQTMQDSSDARGERLQNQKMKFQLELQKHADKMKASRDSSDKAQDLKLLKITNDLANQRDSVAYERARNSKRTVDPNWTPNIYGMKAVSGDFFKETRGINSDNWIGSKAGWNAVGSVINPYDDSDIVSGYNNMQPLLQSDVSQVQKKGVDPKHKEDIVRFLIDAFNRVNKSEFVDDDFFWEDGDSEENAVREDIISKLLQLDYPIDRNTPLNKKVNYK